MLNVREIVAATLCAPLAVILLNGCAGPVTEADRQLASKFDHELYLAGRNTPAEYAVNQMCSNVLNTMLLKEELVPRDPMRYQTARERLKTLEEDIRKGFEWPEKQPPRVNIPFTRAPIVVDGRADEPAWQEALTFHDEYPISSRRKMESGACWKILWDAEFIYGFFNMPQKTFQVVRERLWLGGCRRVVHRFGNPVPHLLGDCRGDRRQRVRCTGAEQSLGSLYCDSDGIHPGIENGGPAR